MKDCPGALLSHLAHEHRLSVEVPEVWSLVQADSGGSPDAGFHTCSFHGVFEFTSFGSSRLHTAAVHSVRRCQAFHVFVIQHSHISHPQQFTPAYKFSWGRISWGAASSLVEDFTPSKQDPDRVEPGNRQDVSRKNPTDMGIPSLQMQNLPE